VNIDVHILTLPNSNRKYLAKAIASLQHDPVNLYIVPGVAGDIGSGRMMGFCHGIAPYVSFVDEDDLVELGAFSRISDAIVENPDCAFYTNEILIDSDGNKIGDGFSKDPTPFKGNRGLHLAQVPGQPGKYMHHLVCYPRVSLAGLDLSNAERFSPETTINNHVAKTAKFVELPFVGYRWRIHSGNSSSHLWK